MWLYCSLLIGQLFPFLYAEVIRPGPTEGKWGVIENRDCLLFSIKIMNIHFTCATSQTHNACRAGLKCLETGHAHKNFCSRL